MGENRLYYGDNLDVLRRYVKDESVDLVYLDPPFNSQQDYSVFFQERDGSKAAAQIKAFEDTWTWDTEAARAYEGLVESGGRVGEAMQAFHTFLGPSDMLAYLAMMAPRLVELRRAMKLTASIWLHCDPTANHYLKMLMDAVFGPENFRNEVVWYYYNKMHDRRKRMFPQANDTLLFYVKDVRSDFTFTQLKEMRDEPVKQLVRKKVGGRMVNAKDEKGHVIYRIKEDRTIDNVWRIPCLQPAAQEKLGYPTQKPEALLERIIAASSNPGDMVLDPFCGCGTTIAAAERLGRRWIGIDITHLAIALIKHRLRNAFGEAVAIPKAIGEPTSLPDAEVLAKEDPYQFQCWSLGLLGARPTELKKGADRGIDGRSFFFTNPQRSGKPDQVIYSVKAGKMHATYVRDLVGVVAREKAAIGVLACMDEPTAAMRKEAAAQGFYKSPELGDRLYAKAQLLTIKDILGGKQVDMPAFARGGGDATFKKAPLQRPLVERPRTRKLSAFGGPEPEA